jgi:hypothetical protein
MFGFYKEIKKEVKSELEKLRDDDNLTHIVRPFLEKYRMLIKMLSSLSKKGAPLEEQDAVYRDICALEKYITKFGHCFVIESEYPYAYCMTNERYVKYLGIKNSKRYLKYALEY